MDKKPTINDQNINKLLVATFGVQPVVAHYTNKARSAALSCSTAVTGNNPIAVAQKLGEVIEALDVLQRIVNARENIDDIDNIKTS